MPAKMGLAAGIRRSAPSPIPTRPPRNCAELAVVQVRRNSDTFSPQAWRGDEGARRVPARVEPVRCPKMQSKRRSIRVPNRWSIGYRTDSGIR